MNHFTFSGVSTCADEWHLRRKLSAVNFSSSNSQGSGQRKPKSDFSGESNNDGSNPPFLTILAGILVFLLFAWTLGFIVLWIFRIFLGW